MELEFGALDPSPVNCLRSMMIPRVSMNKRMRKMKRKTKRKKSLKRKIIPRSISHELHTPAVEAKDIKSSTTTTLVKTLKRDDASGRPLYRLLPLIINLKLIHDPLE